VITVSALAQNFQTHIYFRESFQADGGHRVNSSVA
jgi:hypothetical protein